MNEHFEQKKLKSVYLETQSVHYDVHFDSVCHNRDLANAIAAWMQAQRWYVFNIRESRSLFESTVRREVYMAVLSPYSPGLDGFVLH